MYYIARVDMPEDFRNKLSQFMSGIRSTILKDAQNRFGKYESGNYPLSLPIYRKMHDIVYSLLKTKYVFPGVFIYHGTVRDG